MTDQPSTQGIDPATTAAAGLEMMTLTRWLSPAFPLGSFAYSQGLEVEISAGRVANAAQVEDWLEQVVRFGGLRTDAILLIAARQGTEGVADLARALAPSAERWQETFQQGSAFARTLNGMGQGDISPAALPVAVGVASARLAHLSDAVVAAHYLQAALSSLVSACVRFVPLGQTEGQRILEALAPVAHSVAQEAAVAGLEDIGSAAIGADLAAAEHETMEVRIFRS